MTPLETFTRQLPTMPLDRLEKVLESLKGSVGGGDEGEGGRNSGGGFQESNTG